MTLSLVLVLQAVAQPADLREDWADRVFEADLDGNRRVTLDEAKAHFDEMTDEVFAVLDRNEDGQILRRELEPAELDATLIRDSIAKAMESDRNGDGRVAYGEIIAARPGYPNRNFDRLDLNGDGFVSHDDLEALASDRPPVDVAAEQDDPDGRTRRVARLYRLLLESDTNADRNITFEEAHARMPNLTRERFDRLDRDGDGVLTNKDRRQK